MVLVVRGADCVERGNGKKYISICVYTNVVFRDCEVFGAAIIMYKNGNSLALSYDQGGTTKRMLARQ